MFLSFDLDLRIKNQNSYKKLNKISREQREV